jgi:hypothetical protein
MSVPIARALQTIRVRDTWSVRGILASMAVLPVIYSLAPPFVLLDLCVQTYQRICFPLLGIERVRRREYLRFDRHRLGYLNLLQKGNCLYCGYVNGLVAFVRDVAARTEQFWCPIQHANHPRGKHRRQQRFAPYGDAAAFERLQPELRRELAVRTKRRVRTR